MLFIFLYPILKTSPENAPAVLPTDFTKADLPKLKEDMKKWESVFSTTSRDWWTTFLEYVAKDTDDTTADECPIFELKNAFQRPVTQPEEDVGTTQIDMQFREKEVAPLDEVYKHIEYSNLIQIMRDVYSGSNNFVHINAG